MPSREVPRGRVSREVNKAANKEVSGREAVRVASGKVAAVVVMAGTITATAVTRTSATIRAAAVAVAAIAATTSREAITRGAARVVVREGMLRSPRVNP